MIIQRRNRKSTSPIRQLIEESRYASRKLIFNGHDVRFESEQDLESYIEDRFEDIFPGLILLARQYTSANQRCDLICAKKSNKQLVIIELKNQIDRYIVAQLIRYRKALLLEQPFVGLLDYSLPIELIAAAPKFHEDNYTDKEACKFEENIHFLTFSIEYKNETSKFNLLEKEHELNFPICGLTDVSPDLQYQHYLMLPEVGFFTGKLAELPTNYTQDFLILHSLFMRQPMVKHWTTNGNKILYSTGKGENSKKLAEVTNTSRGLYLYLWLPSRVKTNVKLPLARFGLVCEKNCSPLALTSTVKWVVCTNDTVDIKEEPNRSVNNGLCSTTRQGMPKWSKASSYLEKVATYSPNTRSLINKLFEDAKQPLDFQESDFWEKIQDNTPTHLGWYVDLAVMTWNYRLKK
jgi:Endonuclease NucS